MNLDLRLEPELNVELELDALELLPEEQGLTGGCGVMTCGFVSCLDWTCGYASYVVQ